MKVRSIDALSLVLMRLINARTLKLEEVEDETEKEYAILSHRWQDGEVSFSDIQNLEEASQKRGFEKIRESCSLALEDGHSYLWVDTCCINKDSSAELSQAINSMYRWYQAAAVCYAFLGDVSANHSDDDAVKESIQTSQWFTRGWTLQELLAPHNVQFYDKYWKLLGTKRTLSSTINSRTGIDVNVLHGNTIASYSIAQRMSWASDRVTRRKEDIAYCLLGLFDVNMPLLYGEGGAKAFLRLQEEIIKQSDDHTIFSWSIHRDKQPGLLADSPKAFADCGRNRTIRSRKGRSSYLLTNRGLSIKLPAVPLMVDTYLVFLDCVRLPLAPGNKEPHLGMFLRRLHEDDQYARIRYNGETFLEVSDLLKRTNKMLKQPWELFETIAINVRQVVDVNTTDYHDRINGFRIATAKILETDRSGKDLFTFSSVAQWDSQQRSILLKTGDMARVGYLDIRPQNWKIKVIGLGFDFEFNPVCFVAAEGGIEEKFRTINGYGRSNHSIDAENLKVTTEEHAQSLGIYQRSPHDQLGWSEVHNGLASDLEHHRGLWALKGDRISGLTVQVGELATLRITKNIVETKVVWELYLENIVKEGTFNKILKKL